MKTVKLSEISDIKAGGTPSRDKKEYWSNATISWCKIKDFTGKYLDKTEEKITNIGLENSSAKLFKKGTILFSIFATIGEVTILKINATTNQAIAGIEIISEDVDVDYLYYYLKNMKSNVLKLSRGVAQNNINLGILKNLEIKLYEVEKQRKIANQLDKVQELININKEQIELLDELTKSQFVEMFGDPNFNEFNWKIGTIRDFVDEVRYGTSKPAKVGGKYKYLRMNNITYNGKLDLTDIKYIDIPENEIEKCSTKNGDVLFNRTNSRDLVGKTCVYNIDEKMVIAGFVIRVRVNDFANPYFLSEYLNTKYMKKKLYNMCKNASGQSNINAQELQNIKIYMPPIELQNQFAGIVKQIEKQKFNYQKNLEEAQELMNTLMNQYFN